GLLGLLLAQPAAVAGAFAFGAAAAVWCVFEAYRFSVPPAVSAQPVDALPEWFHALSAFAGRMFTIYMLTAYLSVAAFGWAILAGVTLAAWTGYLALVFGLSAAASLATRLPRVGGASPFEPPVMVHVVPAVLGVALLFK